MHSDDSARIGMTQRHEDHLAERVPGFRVISSTGATSRGGSFQDLVDGGGVLGHQESGEPVPILGVSEPAPRQQLGRQPSQRRVVAKRGGELEKLTRISLFFERGGERLDLSG